MAIKYTEVPSKNIHKSIDGSLITCLRTDTVIKQARQYKLQFALDQTNLWARGDIVNIINC